MLLSHLEYGALFSYTPHGITEKERKSIEVMRLLKADKIPKAGSKPMSALIAEKLSDIKRDIPYRYFFTSEAVLIPIPSTSLMRPGTLWVPKNLAVAMEKLGFGEVHLALERIIPLQKAATSRPADRPKAIDHYRTLHVKSLQNQPQVIILIDDIITRGATMLGSASRLNEVFPNSKIFGFAAMRAISNSSEFKTLQDPCYGEISLKPNGETIRFP